MCCKYNNPNEAFGWPPRTVRALIALSSVFVVFHTFCAVIVILVIKEQYSIAMSLAGALLGIIGSIIGYYFGTRGSTPASDNLNHSDIENNITNNLSPVVKLEPELSLPSSHNNNNTN